MAHERKKRPLWRSHFIKPFHAEIIKLEELREHEETSPSRLKRLIEEITLDGVLKRPIAVDKNTNIILDGEHRFNALKQLGCKKIPVIFVDYNSTEIEVKCWRRKENHPTKKMVIEAGLTGQRLPSRTTKHVVRVGDKVKHITFIQRRVDVSLEKLKEADAK